MIGQQTAAISQIRRWLTDEALPFWATTGFNNDLCIFEERTSFSGRPVSGVPHRLMVQCRQIYVYSHATLLGWFDGRALVEKALQSIQRHYIKRSPGVPCIFSISETGDIVDPRSDAYGYAFLLFALAWARKMLGDAVAPRIQEELLCYFSGELRHRSGVGFIDGLPRPDHRMRQNPHMHLFEACLEVGDAFDSPYAVSLAHELYGLFRDRLLERQLRALPELFDDDWRVVRNFDAWFEPGHHFEWIWLLNRFSAKTGIDVEEDVRILGHRAYSEGIDSEGAAIEAVSLDGTRRQSSRRCWATCEAMKAAASVYEKDDLAVSALDRATTAIQALQRIFLSKPFGAGWIDRVDQNGNPLVDFVPASSLYHIFLAVARMHRVFGGPN
jgi:mannose/cellobiose epimerase-like protein (N-acyl-D-glucosamine 2-epimerase family)